MSDYEKQTKFADLGMIYIKDGKKYATIRLGSESFFLQLEDAPKKFANLLASGNIDQAEHDEKVQNLANKGAKYRMKLIVDQ